MKTYHFVLVLTLINYTLTHFQVLAPSELRNFFNKKGGIKFDIGRFGEVPFGKTLSGFAYLHYSNKVNDWCNPEEFNMISLNTLGDLNSNPLVIAEEGNCSLTTKAKNIQNANGAAMILIAKDSNFAEDSNVDDPIGINVYIPTVIINKDDGDRIKNNLISNPNEHIAISLSFKTIIEGDKIEIDLYLRSDEVKALHFFKEFEQYKNKLGDNFSIRPIYKYITCFHCPSTDKLEEKPENDCFKGGEYCGGFNVNLGVHNSRLILIENLRQKCIYNSYGQDIYWNYMIGFSDSCADINFPTFTTKCAQEIMKVSRVSETVINDCMNKTLNPEETEDLLEQDTMLFNKNQIYRYPAMDINGIRYKGSWYAKHMFNTICNGFLENHDVCTSQSEISPVSNDAGFGVGEIVILVIFALVIMITMIYCYKRLVNKGIDQSIEERIERQTKESLGHYSEMNSTSYNA